MEPKLSPEANHAFHFALYEAADAPVLLDLARSVALVGMATFHFMFDLVMFGHQPPEVILHGFWPLWARVVASSFLFLSGVGLYLAYGQGIDLRRLLRRLVKIAGAAVVVTLATRAAMGDQYVFWGILHMIAFGSLAGLLFLRLPAAVTLTVAAGVFWIGQTVASPALDAAPLLFLGLGAEPVYAVDYVPVFPWLAPVLAGRRAALLELAHAFAEGPPPKRSVVFAAWSGEEAGLLGSTYYAANPVWPLETTVANINMDSLLPGVEIDPNIVVIGPGAIRIFNTFMQV